MKKELTQRALWALIALNNAGRGRLPLITADGKGQAAAVEELAAVLA